MANVCVSDDFRIEGGKLGLTAVPAAGAWLPTIGSGLWPNSGIPGGPNFGRITELPGMRISSAYVQVWNSYGVPLRMMVRAQRPTIALNVSNPNAAQVRSKWAYKVTDEAIMDPNHVNWLPDPSQDFDLQVGVSMDAGASNGGVPTRGVIMRAYPPASLEEPVPAVVQPGQHITVWFASYLWTPPPWSDNANNNNPKHTIETYGYSIIDLYRLVDTGAEVRL